MPQLTLYASLLLDGITYGFEPVQSKKHVGFLLAVPVFSMGGWHMAKNLPWRHMV